MIVEIIIAILWRWIPETTSMWATCKNSGPRLLNWALKAAEMAEYTGYSKPKAIDCMP